MLRKDVAVLDHHAAPSNLEGGKVDAFADGLLVHVNVACENRQIDQSDTGSHDYEGIARHAQHMAANREIHAAETADAVPGGIKAVTLSVRLDIGPDVAQRLL